MTSRVASTVSCLFKVRYDLGGFEDSLGGDGGLESDEEEEGGEKSCCRVWNFFVLYDLKEREKASVSESKREREREKAIE